MYVLIGKKLFISRFFLTFKRCNRRFSEKSSLKNDFKSSAQLKITECNTEVYIPEKLTNKISRSDFAVLLWKRQLYKTPLNFIVSLATPLNTSVERTMIGKEGPSTFLSVMLFSVKKKSLKF